MLTPCYTNDGTEHVLVLVFARADVSALEVTGIAGAKRNASGLESADLDAILVLGDLSRLAPSGCLAS
jgi:hypothetical protein